MIYEIIIFAALAVVICVLLYSILGKDIGMGPDEGFNFENIMEAKQNEKNNAANNVVPLNAEQSIYADIYRLDSNFNKTHFMDGAKAAYSMILEAFASGDKETLKMLLTKDVYAIYEDAINNRDKQNYRQVTDLGRLKSAVTKQVKLDGTIARIHVLYEAELTSALLNEKGEIVEGDPDVMSTISEIWEYERDLKSSNINWLLADVVPSEGDVLGVDPSPDTKTATPKED